ncbi:eIF2 kinase IF2K-A (incomplete catalytic triad) [Besnoitia besnoiti]|uniref:non-specific serine/threonine protein kinase n=1 Tax=Besnoitia besnoiti TaxID=94643 RepID=A0A2A9M7F2_BESBE|nr:eIF2 kinase IF2K-A (incomplete catalytic triad) [Besnoitia besnoiti]PFH33114.1 eIF2 kinase IF2K-A (incomplete catalytic triad) [Besnoitia besnoiti]
MKDAWSAKEQSRRTPPPRSGLAPPLCLPASALRPVDGGDPRLAWVSPAQTPLLEVRLQSSTTKRQLDADTGAVASPPPSAPLACGPSSSSSPRSARAGACEGRSQTRASPPSSSTEPGGQPTALLASGKAFFLFLSTVCVFFFLWLGATGFAKGPETRAGGWAADAPATVSSATGGGPQGRGGRERRVRCPLGAEPRDRWAQRSLSASPRVNEVAAAPPGCVAAVEEAFAHVLGAGLQEEDELLSRHAVTASFQRRPLETAATSSCALFERHAPLGAASRISVADRERRTFADLRRSMACSETVRPLARPRRTAAGDRGVSRDALLSFALSQGERPLPPFLSSSASWRTSLTASPPQSPFLLTPSPSCPSFSTGKPRLRPTEDQPDPTSAKALAFARPSRSFPLALDSRRQRGQEAKGPRHAGRTSASSSGVSSDASAPAREAESQQRGPGGLARSLSWVTASPAPTRCESLSQASLHESWRSAEEGDREDDERSVLSFSSSNTSSFASQPRSRRGSLGDDASLPQAAPIGAGAAAATSTALCHREECPQVSEAPQFHLSSLSLACASPDSSESERDEGGATGGKAYCRASRRPASFSLERKRRPPERPRRRPREEDSEEDGSRDPALEGALHIGPLQPPARRRSTEPPDSSARLVPPRRLSSRASRPEARGPFALETDGETQRTRVLCAEECGEFVISCSPNPPRARWQRAGSRGRCRASTDGECAGLGGDGRDRRGPRRSGPARTRENSPGRMPSPSRAASGRSRPTQRETDSEGAQRDLSLGKRGGDEALKGSSRPSQLGSSFTKRSTTGGQDGEPLATASSPSLSSPLSRPSSLISSGVSAQSTLSSPLSSAPAGPGAAPSPSPGPSSLTSASPSSSSPASSALARSPRLAAAAAAAAAFAARESLPSFLNASAAHASDASEDAADGRARPESPGAEAPVETPRPSVEPSASSEEEGESETQESDFLRREASSQSQDGKKNGNLRESLSELPGSDDSLFWAAREPHTSPRAKRGLEEAFSSAGRSSASDSVSVPMASVSASSSSIVPHHTPPAGSPSPAGVRGGVEGGGRGRGDERGDQLSSSRAPSSLLSEGEREGRRREEEKRTDMQSLIVLSVTGDLYHVTTNGSFVWQRSLGSSLATAFDLEPSSSEDEEASLGRQVAAERSSKGGGRSEEARAPRRGGGRVGGDAESEEEGRGGGRESEEQVEERRRRNELAQTGLGRRLLPAHDGSLFFLDDDGSLTALHVSIPEVVNHLPFQAPLFPHVYFAGEREVRVTALALETGHPIATGQGLSRKRRDRGRRRREREKRRAWIANKRPGADREATLSSSSREEEAAESSETEEEEEEDEEEPRQLQFGVTVWKLWAVDNRTHTTQWGLKWVEVDALGSLSAPAAGPASSSRAAYLRNLIRVDDDKLYLLPSPSFSPAAGFSRVPEASATEPGSPVSASEAPTPSAGGAATPRAEEESLAARQSLSSLPASSSPPSSFASSFSSPSFSPGAPGQAAAAAPLFLKFPAPIAAVYVVGPSGGEETSLAKAAGGRGRRRAADGDEDDDERLFVLSEGEEEPNGRRSRGLGDEALARASGAKKSHATGRGKKFAGKAQRTEVVAPVTLECIVRQWGGSTAALPFAYVPSAQHHPVRGRGTDVFSSPFSSSFSLPYPPPPAAHHSYATLLLPAMRGLGAAPPGSVSPASPAASPPGAVGALLPLASSSFSSQAPSDSLVLRRREDQIALHSSAFAGAPPLANCLEDAKAGDARAEDAELGRDARQKQDGGDDEATRGSAAPPRQRGGEAATYDLLPAAHAVLPLAPPAYLLPAGEPGASPFFPLSSAAGAASLHAPGGGGQSAVPPPFSLHNFRAPAPVKPIRFPHPSALSSHMARQSDAGFFGDFPHRDLLLQSTPAQRSQGDRTRTDEATGEAAGDRRPQRTRPGQVEADGRDYGARKEEEEEEEEEGGDDSGPRHARDSDGLENDRGTHVPYSAVRDGDSAEEEPKREENWHKGRLTTRGAAEEGRDRSGGGDDGTRERRRAVASSHNETLPHAGGGGAGAAASQGYASPESPPYGILPSDWSELYGAPQQAPLSFNPVLSPVLSVLRRWIGRLTRSSSSRFFSPPPLGSDLDTSGADATPPPAVGRRHLELDAERRQAVGCEAEGLESEAPRSSALFFPSSSSLPFSASSHSWFRPHEPPAAAPNYAVSLRQFTGGRGDRRSCRVDRGRGAGAASTSEAPAHAADSAGLLPWDVEGSLATGWLARLLLVFAAASSVMVFLRFRGFVFGALASAFAAAPSAGGDRPWWRSWRSLPLLLPVLRYLSAQGPDGRGERSLLESEEPEDDEAGRLRPQTGRGGSRSGRPTLTLPISSVHRAENGRALSGRRGAEAVEGGWGRAMKRHAGCRVTVSITDASWRTPKSSPTTPDAKAFGQLALPGSFSAQTEVHPPAGGAQSLLLSPTALALRARATRNRSTGWAPEAAPEGEQETGSRSVATTADKNLSGADLRKIFGIVLEERAKRQEKGTFAVSPSRPPLSDSSRMPWSWRESLNAEDTESRESVGDLTPMFSCRTTSSDSLPSETELEKPGASTEEDAALATLETARAFGLGKERRPGNRRGEPERLLPRGPPGGFLTPSAAVPVLPSPSSDRGDATAAAAAPRLLWAQGGERRGRRNSDSSSVYSTSSLYTLPKRDALWVYRRGHSLADVTGGGSSVDGAASARHSSAGARQRPTASEESSHCLASQSLSLSPPRSPLLSPAEAALRPRGRSPSASPRLGERRCVPLSVPLLPSAFPAHDAADLLRAPSSPWVRPERRGAPSWGSGDSGDLADAAALLPPSAAPPPEPASVARKPGLSGAAAEAGWQRAAGLLEAACETDRAGRRPGDRGGVQGVGGPRARFGDEALGRERSAGEEGEQADRDNRQCPPVYLPGGRMGGGPAGESFSTEEWQRLMFRRAGRRCNSVGQLTLYGGGSDTSLGASGAGSRPGLPNPFAAPALPPPALSSPAEDVATPQSDAPVSSAVAQSAVGADVDDRKDSGPSAAGVPEVADARRGSSLQETAAPAEVTTPMLGDASSPSCEPLPLPSPLPAGDRAQGDGGPPAPGASENGRAPADSAAGALQPPPAGGVSAPDGEVDVLKHAKIDARGTLSGVTTTYLGSAAGAASSVSPTAAGGSVLSATSSSAGTAALQGLAATQALSPAARLLAEVGGERRQEGADGAPTDGGLAAAWGEGEGRGEAGAQAAAGGGAGAKSDRQERVHGMQDEGEGEGGTPGSTPAALPPPASPPVGLADGKLGGAAVVPGGLDVSEVAIVAAPPAAMPAKVDRGIPPDSSLAKLLENGRFERTFGIQKLVGQGGFGVVYQVRHLLEPGHPIYAVKLILLRLSLSEDISLRRDFREVAANRDLYSKHVVRYYTWWCEEPRFLPVDSLGSARGVLTDRKCAEEISSSAVGECSAILPSRGPTVSSSSPAPLESSHCLSPSPRPLKPRAGAAVERRGAKAREGGAERPAFLDETFLGDSDASQDAEGDGGDGARRRRARSSAAHKHTKRGRTRGGGGGARALCLPSPSQWAEDSSLSSWESQEGVSGRRPWRRSRRGTAEGDESIAKQRALEQQDSEEGLDTGALRDGRRRGSFPGVIFSWRSRASLSSGLGPEDLRGSTEEGANSLDCSRLARSTSADAFLSRREEEHRGGRSRQSSLPGASSVSQRGRAGCPEGRRLVREAGLRRRACSPSQSPSCHQPGRPATGASAGDGAARGRRGAALASSVDSEALPLCEVYQRRGLLSTKLRAVSEGGDAARRQDAVGGGKRAKARRPHGAACDAVSDAECLYTNGVSHTRCGADGCRASRAACMCGRSARGDAESRDKTRQATAGAQSANAEKDRAAAWGGDAGNKEGERGAAKTGKAKEHVLGSPANWSVSDVSFDLNCYLNTQERDMIVFEETSVNNAADAVVSASPRSAGEARPGPKGGETRGATAARLARLSPSGRERGEASCGDAKSLAAAMQCAGRAHALAVQRTGRDLVATARAERVADKRNAREPPAKETLYPVVLLIQMEMCNGVTLREWLDRTDRGTVAMGFVPSSKNRWNSLELELFKQLMKGIRDIHERGIVHRDLKPENIFVDPNTLVLKIVDFGLAKFIQRENSNTSGAAAGQAGASGNAEGGGGDGADGERNREKQKQKIKGLLAKARRMGKNMEMSYKGEVIGTPAYAAPEGGGLCDEKADIYSSALILLELLCPRFTTVMERVKTLEDFKTNYAVPEHIRLHLHPWYLLMKEMAQPEPQHRPSAYAVLKQAKMLLSSPAADLHHERGMLVYTDPTSPQLGVSSSFSLTSPSPVCGPSTMALPLDNAASSPLE